jgi:hypothetical protein
MGPRRMGGRRLGAETPAAFPRPLKPQTRRGARGHPPMIVKKPLGRAAPNDARRPSLAPLCWRWIRSSGRETPAARCGGTVVHRVARRPRTKDLRGANSLGCRRDRTALAPFGGESFRWRTIRSAPPWKERPAAPAFGKTPSAGRPPPPAAAPPRPALSPTDWIRPRPPTVPPSAPPRSNTRPRPRHAPRAGAPRPGSPLRPFGPSASRAGGKGRDRQSCPGHRPSACRGQNNCP